MSFKKQFLKIKHRKILDQIEKIEISEYALEKYKYCVKGNRKKDTKSLKNKLKRNFILSKKMDNRTFRYGNLFMYCDNYVIKNIENVKGGNNEFNINEKLKKELNVILGLE